MDIYAEITNRIMEQMENGVIPWRKPWVAAGSAISHATGKSYSLLNQMLLGRPGEYLTFKQVQSEGGKVRKGAKAQIVVFWKWITVTDDETQDKGAQATSGEDIYPQPRSCDAKRGGRQEKEVPILRYYNVFHIDQCEGLKAKHMPELPNTANAHETAEQIINSYTQRERVTLHQSEGDRAFYRPSSDSITVPHMAQFTATAEYYSTVFHEMVHSTGHAKRLNRIDKTAFFGSEAYSKEELIAEIGASALVNHVGLETADSFRNNTAYVQNWLTVLRNDKRFIVSAAGKAEKAVNLILG